MRPRSALYSYQRESARLKVEAKQIANFLEPGYGKTAATLTAIHDLGRPRTLVLAPARVADTVWDAEAAQWEHLSNMDVRAATGDREQRLAVLASNADVVTLSYENFPWLLDQLDVRKRFQCVVFDELSRMKNVNTVKFRRFRGAVRDIPFRFGLTGTPVGNHLIDIWGEMYMVAGEKPLGPTKGEFVGRYFAPGARNSRGDIVSWRPHPYAQKEIEQRIKPYAFTLVSGDAPPMPEPRLHRIEVELPAEVERMSAEMAADLTTKLESGTDLYTFSENAAAMKVRQLASGAVYTDPPTKLGEPRGPRKWEVVHGRKVAALEELVNELQGQPLLVFYWFQHERDRILAAFKGRARELRTAADIGAWNAGQVEILLAHPASAGHGLNLQHGGHHICWFTLPWSLELWKQANGREVRQGQKSPYVMLHLLMAGRADEKVLDVLWKKSAVEDQLLQAMIR
jgi:hypothetical protein